MTNSGFHVTHNDLLQSRDLARLVFEQHCIAQANPEPLPASMLLIYWFRYCVK